MKWRNLSQQQAARNSASCKLLIINNFTLVELLVVIAIITILMAMLMPAMASARKMAYRAECSGNLKQLGSAIIMYSDDYQWTPCAYNSAYPVSPRDLRCWTSQLFYGKYISGRPDYGSPYSGTVFACPSPGTPMLNDT